MTVHLIKLCVGCDSVRELEDWIKEKLKAKRKNREKPEHIHRTRMVPKRAAELVDGGSLYWVIPAKSCAGSGCTRSGPSSIRTASAGAALCSSLKWFWSSPGRIALFRA